jgi:hypothetical protein
MTRLLTYDSQWQGMKGRGVQRTRPQKRPRQKNVHKKANECKSSAKMAARVIQTIHEIRAGARVSSILLADIGVRWKALPHRRPLSDGYYRGLSGV